MSHHEMEYEKRIRAQGYRLTPQRQAIMDALCAIGDHAGVNDVYERVHLASPAVDRATVYRTLHFFRELGLVTVSEMEGETVYEVAGPVGHHHLICTNCGREQTVRDADLQGLVDHLAARYGFAADLQHLVLPGVCAGCRAAVPADS